MSATAIDPHHVSVAERPFELDPISPTIGACVHGIDLREALSDAVVASIYEALLDWKVLFFRDQALSTEQHIAFARRFGELEVHPFATHKEGYPEVLSLEHDEQNPGTENLWHSDVTWRLQPSLGSVLRCLECPKVGGDTLFADMYAAYESLPERLKSRIDGAVARHDFDGFRKAMQKRGASEQELEAFDRQYPHPEHPVVRTHPDTGRRALYVNRAFTREIIGLGTAQSDELLSELYARAAVPEFQCRFSWRPDSIAFWDNRSCQHYATSDYWPQVRHMERVTVAGDTPFFHPESNDCPSNHLSASSPFRGQVERYQLRG